MSVGIEWKERSRRRRKRLTLKKIGQSSSSFNRTFHFLSVYTLNIYYIVYHPQILWMARGWMESLLECNLQLNIAICRPIRILFKLQHAVSLNIQIAGTLYNIYVLYYILSYFSNTFCRLYEHTPLSNDKHRVSCKVIRWTQILRVSAVASLFAQLTFNSGRIYVSHLTNCLTASVNDYCRSYSTGSYSNAHEDAALLVKHTFHVHLSVVHEFNINLYQMWCASIYLFNYWVNKKTFAYDPRTYQGSIY